MRISDLIAPAILGFFLDGERTVSADDAKSLKGFTLSELERPLNIALEPVRAAFAKVSGAPVKFEANDLRGVIVKNAGLPHERRPVLDAKGKEVTDEEGNVVTEPFPIVRVPDGLIDSTGRGGSTFYAAREEWERYENVYEDAPSYEDAVRALALVRAREDAAAGGSAWGVLAILARSPYFSGSVKDFLAKHDNAE